MNNDPICKRFVLDQNPLSLYSGRVFRRNSVRPEFCLAVVTLLEQSVRTGFCSDRILIGLSHSARAECSDEILFCQNSAWPWSLCSVTLLGQSVQTGFCSAKNRARLFGTLLGQSVRTQFCSGRTVLGRLALCLGRVFGHDFARAEPCSAVWHSARAECSDTILFRQNRARPFGTLPGQSVRTRFYSGRTVFGRLALCSGRVFGKDSARAECSRIVISSSSSSRSGRVSTSSSEFGTSNPQLLRPLSSEPLRPSSSQPPQPSTSQSSPSLPTKNALGDVKNQAEDEANPKPWYMANDKSSKMSTEDLVELLREYPLPVGWYARLPGLQEPANYGTKYETGIYEQQVRSGYRLPLHPFALHFFEHYHMAPGQLVPNGWRKLVGLIYLVQTSGYKPDATDFMRVFFEICFVKGVANCPGWYYIHSRQRLLKGGPKSNKGWHSRYFFVGRSDKGKLPFDREWNPYCKDFENPGKPAPNNLTKHILSHIKLWGGLSIDEPLSEQQLESARIIPHMPVPAGAVTPPAPTISSTFLVENASLEMASGSGKTPQGGFLGVLQKAKGKRKEKQPSAELPPAPKKTRVIPPDHSPQIVEKVSVKEDPIFVPDGLFTPMMLGCQIMYASGSEMLSRFEMARQVAAEEAQQKREALKEAEEATRRAEELSKQDTDYLAQIETLERILKRAKRRVAEEVKKARDQGICNFLDGNAGDEWLKKRVDDGLKIKTPS
ncbi:hypothetical protein RJ639_007939 [Escallonia herrerae]|uniref:Transposase (putative) gypsy type domain-containing protein n=1 Tax=Escallonia herrerae TaxID=1293975 RepID=A0AA88VR16_9ASTE|nr:hypothetical protein RJ639_007939 [Escallonia herrerae]